jgi:hypothetical protein
MGWASSWDRRMKTISAEDASTNHTKGRKVNGKILTRVLWKTRYEDVGGSASCSEGFHYWRCAVKLPQSSRSVHKRSGARPRLNNNPPPGVIFSQVCPDLVTGIKNNAVPGEKINSMKEATINLRVQCVREPPRPRVCGSLVCAIEEQLLLPTQGETTRIYKVQGYSHERTA